MTNTYIRGLSLIRIVFFTIVFVGFSIGTVYAFDENTCNDMFASANVEKVKKFKISGGGADFGDNPHLFGSAQGDAVLCWSIDGRVAMKGRSYCDGVPPEPQVVTVKIRFRRTSGDWTNWTTRGLTCGNNLPAVLANRTVEKVSPTGEFNRVRMKLLESGHTDLGLYSITVRDLSFNR